MTDDRKQRGAGSSGDGCDRASEEKQAPPLLSLPDGDLFLPPSSPPAEEVRNMFSHCCPTTMLLTELNVVTTKEKPQMAWTAAVTPLSPPLKGPLFVIGKRDGGEEGLR